MEKIYCKIFNQKIFETKCYFCEDPVKYSSNPYCQSCNYFQDTLKQKISPISITEIRQTPPKLTARKVTTIISGREPKARELTIEKKPWKAPTKVKSGLISEELYIKNPYLRDLIDQIPCLLRINSSFWDNPKFLRWQLMRLNKMWQEDLSAVNGLYNDGFGDDQLISDLNDAFETDYFPDAGDSFAEWKRSYQGRAEIFEQKRLGINIREVRFLRCCAPESNPTNPHSLIGFRAKDQEEKLLLPDPEYFLVTDPPPIDFRIHFPFPYFLEKLPPYTKTKKGSPLNWCRHLLTYELHQCGVDIETIPSLTFKSKSRRTYEEIHSQEEQVKRMLRRIETDISNSYPFSIL